MNIAKAQEQVRQFTLGLKGEGRNLVSRCPGAWPSQKNVKELCRKLIEEEAKELLDAIEADDWVEIIDGAADLIYVVLFLCVKAGIELEDFWNEVCQNNMTKLDGPIDPETGKQLKPPGWKPPRIQELFELSLQRYLQVERHRASKELITLKTAVNPFDAVWNKRKFHEWRKDDGRDYRPGNYLLLREFEADEYTGREILAKITYVSREEMMNSYFPERELPKEENDRWVVLSIEPVARFTIPDEHSTKSDEKRADAPA